jgi:hypothetical protein
MKYQLIDPETNESSFVDELPSVIAPGTRIFVLNADGITYVEIFDWKTI